MALVKITQAEGDSESWQFCKGSPNSEFNAGFPMEGGIDEVRKLLIQQFEFGHAYEVDEERADIT